ncbi:MAG: hypothetical protein U1D30_08400 [Planctomycetota bacterium]
MRHIARIGVGFLLLSMAACRKCDVCYNIGGPCGAYSLAGRGDHAFETVEPTESTQVPTEKLDTPKNSTQPRNPPLPLEPSAPRAVPSKPPLSRR